MANPLFNFLINTAFADIPRPPTLIGRLDLFKTTLKTARSLGVKLPSMSQALSTFRQIGYGVSRPSFSQMYQHIPELTVTAAKQQLLSWSDRIPMELIPRSEHFLSTKYLYTYRVNVLDNTTGQWSEKYVSLGSDKKLTVKQAWNEFTENFIDAGPGALGTFYSQTVNTDSVSFVGVELR